MKGKVSNLFIIGVLFIFLFSLSGSGYGKNMDFKPVNLNPLIETGKFRQKVDSFVIIHDASGSMNDKYKMASKLSLENELIRRFILTIPDLKIPGILRSFGKFRILGNPETVRLYESKQFSKKEMIESFSGIKFGRGISPIDMAISAINSDAKELRGRIAVIIFSDGVKEDMNYKSAINKTEEVVKRLHPNICIYTVLIGNDKGGEKFLNKMADISRCGLFKKGSKIMSPDAMAEFVKQIFLERSKIIARPAAKVILDSDGDGVPDNLDRCPGTPKGVTVDAQGCPLDSDKDGIYDYLDRCPDTPLGAPVDKYGCWNIKNVLFDFDKSEIKPQYYPLLNKIAEVINKNPQIKLLIQGHTDSRGSAEYNQKLSVKRAISVKKYLMERGVSEDRLKTIGYGLTRPIATNLTPEGRALNRRVEFSIIR